MKDDWHLPTGGTIRKASDAVTAYDKAAAQTGDSLIRIAAALEREQDRKDGELLYEYWEKVRWQVGLADAVADSSYELLTDVDQEARVRQLNHAREDIRKFNIAYPWIAAKAGGE